MTKYAISLPGSVVMIEAVTALRMDACTRRGWGDARIPRTRLRP